jgi:hypothetical protein
MSRLGIEPKPPWWEASTLAKSYLKGLLIELLHDLMTMFLKWMLFPKPVWLDLGSSRGDALDKGLRNSPFLVKL